MSYDEIVTDSGTRGMTEAERLIRMQELRQKRREIDLEWHALVEMGRDDGARSGRH